MKLSQKQQQIVSHNEGALLVEASLGCGKTRVLIERVKFLLSLSRYGRILALAPSKLTANKMKELLVDDDSFQQKERVNVGTIHSFCLDLVQSRGNLIGLAPNVVLLGSEEDRFVLLKEVFIENPQLFKAALAYYGDPQSAFQEVLKDIAQQKKNLILPESCTLADPFSLIYSEYNQKLLQQNAIDFDDILLFAYLILTENDSVVEIYNSIYRYICIDEAQNLNFVQYQVIKALCGDSYRNVMMVGDINKSICRLNSSSMISDFVIYFSPVVYKLDENYCSAKRIVEFANRLEHYDSAVNYVYDGELLAVELHDEESEAQYIVDKIEQLMRDGHPDVEGVITPERIAVIARNRYVFAHVEEQLTKRNIPFFFKKTANGLENESAFMKVFELCMRILINRKDYVHLQQLKTLIGNSESGIFNKTNDADGVSILKEILLNTTYEKLLPAIDVLNSEALNFDNALKALEPILSSFEDNERYLVSMDIQQWRNHWSRYCGFVPKQYRTLASFRNQISLGKTKAVAVDSGISLVTAQMSKGSQFDVVFIMGLSEGTFPDYRAIKLGDSQLSQEANNMYVSVTRAKRLCYMTYSATKKMPWGDIKSQEPSRYIADIVTCSPKTVES